MSRHIAGARRAPRVAALMLLAGAALAAAALTGCSSHATEADRSQSQPGPSPTATAAAPAEQPTPGAAPATGPATSAPVSEAALAAAMDTLVYQGTPAAADGGACFAKAVRGSGLSDAALDYIVTEHSTDIVDLASSMRTQVGTADADILASSTLGDRLNDCVNQQVGSTTGSTGGATSTPATAAADLRPRYTIPAGERIEKPAQLEPGLVSMFTAAGRSGNAAQADLIRRNADCLTGVVLGGGLSQRSLRFIAGGAPIGLGAVQTYLPVTRDATRWNAADFSTRLTDCVRE